MTEGRQYFELLYLVYDSHETFVDVGYCDGMSEVSFIENAGENIFKKSIALSLTERIQENFRSRNIGNYEVITRGLWNEKEEFLAAADGSANSHIALSGEDNAVKVKVTTLDKILFGQKASFIKMDIEGAEYHAHEGTRYIIAEYKPKLAICVYYKLEVI